MSIILHCRVLFLSPYLSSSLSSVGISFWYTFWDILQFCTVFTGSPHCDACLPLLSWFIPVQLTAEPMCSSYRTENKTYQHLIPKSALLSLLSTTVGPEHEPLPPNGVVNLWQPKSGTQCGAYGQWTGPYTYQCNVELLGDIASHPQGRQHHQLAHISQLVANSRSHTKTISFHERTLANIQHSQWGQQADIRQCTMPLHTPLVL